jgi:glyoxylase-like metal-dependent hydrolase (beta-lactamase superfamily II)
MRQLKSITDLPSSPPQDGVPVEVWPGILWVRLPLPYRLNHVNVYLVEDDDGWALIDTGLGNAATEQAWKRLFSTVLDRPITRVIATHFHPDHVGMAGWITQRFRVPLYMSQTEYLMALNLHLDPGALEAEHYVNFYLEHGLDPDETQRIVTRGHSYLRIVRPLPLTFRRLCAGDELRIGRRSFKVLTGGGHAPEQVFLYCQNEDLFLSADQVLSRISPNVSVWPIDPDGDPLGLYLRSLDSIAATVPDDVLVLPGHEMPFYNLHDRIAELTAHHELRCGLILDACHKSSKSAAELVPFIFKGNFGPHEMGFAFSEVLSHVNYLLRRGRLETTGDAANCATERRPIRYSAVTA